MRLFPAASPPLAEPGLRQARAAAEASALRCCNAAGQQLQAACHKQICAHHFSRARTDSRRGIMETLHAVLLGGLSATDHERRAAEEQLALLSAEPGYAHATATIACDPTSGCAPEVRQLACLVLKGFVKAGGWSAADGPVTVRGGSNTSRCLLSVLAATRTLHKGISCSLLPLYSCCLPCLLPPPGSPSPLPALNLFGRRVSLSLSLVVVAGEPLVNSLNSCLRCQGDERAAVRGLLMAALADPTGGSVIRTAVAVVMGCIAQEDWPDAWPELITQLVEHLQSGEPDRMAGAVRCLQILSDDISDEQLPPAIEQLWPTLQQLLMTTDPAYLRLRTGAMGILHNLMSTFGLCVGAGIPGAREKLPELLPACVDACAAVLLQSAATPDDTEQFGLKLQALKTTTLLFQTFPKSMNKALPSLLPVIVDMLESSLPVHEAQSIQIGAAGPSVGDYDVDGSAVSMEGCIIELADLLVALVGMPRFRPTLLPFLDRIAYATVGFIQLTELEIEEWTEDLNQYVNAEMDDSMEYSIRLFSINLFHEIGSEFAEVGLAIGESSVILPTLSLRPY